jgi:hypothetical protein
VCRVLGFPNRPHVASMLGMERIKRLVEAVDNAGLEGAVSSRGVCPRGLLWRCLRRAFCSFSRLSRMRQVRNAANPSVSSSCTVRQHRAAAGDLPGIFRFVVYSESQ